MGRHGQVSLPGCGSEVSLMGKLWIRSRGCSQRWLWLQSSRTAAGEGIRTSHLLLVRSPRPALVKYDPSSFHGLYSTTTPLPTPFPLCHTAQEEF